MDNPATPTPATPVKDHEIRLRQLEKEIAVYKSTLAKMTARLDKEALTQKKVIAGLKKENMRLKSRADATYSMLKLAGLSPAGEASLESAQDKLWQGEFGVDYVARHFAEPWEKSRIPFWKDMASRVEDVKSVLELGCNIGANLKAIQVVMPDAKIGGVEINPFAVKALKAEKPEFAIHESSILAYESRTQSDLVFTRGVLIHIAPANLPTVFDKMYKLSKKYILVYENFSPEPKTIATYGKASKDAEAGNDFAFYRDFASDLHKQHPDLEMVATNFRPEEWTEKSPLLRWTLFSKPKKRK